MERPAVRRASASPAHLPGSAAASVLAAGGCAGPQSALQPGGPDAAAIASLHWILLAVSVLVSLVVIGLVAYAVLRRRGFRGEIPPLRLTPEAERAREARLGGEGALTESERTAPEVELYTSDEDRRSLRWIAFGGVALPAVVLTAALLLTLAVHRRLERPGEPDALTVEVVGWQWWWEVRYLGRDGEPLFETANEIHVPAGRRVRFRLRSGDVIHSFWVPRLGGKMDMIPGRVTELSLRADEPGVYRGQCAEYCDEQHAHMSLLVIAEPEDRFRAWAAAQARPAPTPDDSLALAGRGVFLESACAACHAVRGTPAVGDLGPDLTHLASRGTLGALTVPNTTGHLGGWISNPQVVKPGVRMPAVPLSSDELIALLRYLEGLR